MAERITAKHVESMFKNATEALESVGVRPGPGQEWHLQKTMSYWGLYFRETPGGGLTHIYGLDSHLGSSAREAWETLRTMQNVAWAVREARKIEGAL